MALVYRIGMNASRAEGIIRNMNTMDAFKNADRAEMLQNAAKQVGSSLFLLPRIRTSILTREDMGGDSRWHHLLCPVPALLLHHSLLRRP